MLHYFIFFRTWLIEKVKFLAAIRILVYVKLYSRLDPKVYKSQNSEVVLTRHKWSHPFAVDQAFDFKVRYSLFTLYVEGRSFALSFAVTQGYQKQFPKNFVSSVNQIEAINCYQGSRISFPMPFQKFSLKY